jgi:hypothetical protein
MRYGPFDSKLVAGELRLTFAFGLDHHHIMSCHFVRYSLVALHSTLFSTLHCVACCISFL